ncbi:MAG: glycosyltransferase family 2 protein [Faecalibacterium prausnitzii]|nr:glycosyltransferase family 2 protein [Faecalibacterium prausnitzii]
MIKFSVITICLNIENQIGSTITSVLNQTCTEYEYLIKDGVSNDRTLSIAESFAPAFAEKNIPFRVISQPDSGIYDAMNQAIHEAKGEWIILMNAGDQFANQTVLERVEKSGCLEQADVVYGDRILQNGKLFRYQKAGALETIRFALPFGHQSTLTSRELFANQLYSLKFKICSDHHFYLKMYLEGKRFVYYPEAISIFDIHGISANWKPALQETISILEEMPVRDEDAIQTLKNKLNTEIKKEEKQNFLHRHLWRFIPKKLRMKRWELKRKKAGWKTEEEFFENKKDNT